MAWDTGAVDRIVPVGSVGAWNKSNVEQSLGISVATVPVAITSDPVYSGTMTVMAITPKYFVAVAQPGTIVGNIVNADTFGTQLLEVVFHGSDTQVSVVLELAQGNLNLRLANSADHALFAHANVKETAAEFESFEQQFYALSQPQDRGNGPTTRARARTAAAAASGHR